MTGTDPKPPECPQCRRWTLFCGKPVECTGCIAKRERAAAELRAQQQRAWYERTGHCGQCGDPGSYCTCRKPCPCADLHPNGSGLADDALDAFAAAPVAEASDDQGELFGALGGQQ